MTASGFGHGNVLPGSPAQAPDAPVPAAHVHAIADVAARLGRRVVGPPLVVPESTINHNYRVETDAGPLFVRIHPAGRDRARVLLEQRMAACAGANGVPVVAPLADAGGATAWSSGGTLVSVYPWVEGRHFQRGAITPANATTLGALHGQLHAALAGCDEPGFARSPQLTWDTARSIAELVRVDDLIRYYPAPGEARLAIQRGLREQLALLESGLARPSTGFDHVAVQPCHGDYHDRNVIAGVSGAIAAVVDWEMAALTPPAFEVLRALSFMWLLEPELVQSYLAGYRRHRPMPAADFATAIDMWSQHTLHSTWVYRRVFIEGDDRAAQFIAHHPQLVRQFTDSAFRAHLAALAG